MTPPHRCRETNDDGDHHRRGEEHRRGQQTGRHQPRRTAEGMPRGAAAGHLSAEAHQHTADEEGQPSRYALSEQLAVDLAHVELQPQPPAVRGGDGATGYQHGEKGEMGRPGGAHRQGIAGDHRPRTGPARALGEHGLHRLFTELLDGGAHQGIVEKLRIVAERRLGLIEDFVVVAQHHPRPTAGYPQWPLQRPPETQGDARQRNGRHPPGPVCHCRISYLSALSSSATSVCPLRAAIS